MFRFQTLTERSRVTDSAIGAQKKKRRCLSYNETSGQLITNSGLGSSKQASQRQVTSLAGRQKSVAGLFCELVYLVTGMNRGHNIFAACSFDELFETETD